MVLRTSEKIKYDSVLYNIIITGWISSTTQYKWVCHCIYIDINNYTFILGERGRLQESLLYISTSLDTLSPVHQEVSYSIVNYIHRCLISVLLTNNILRSVRSRKTIGVNLVTIVNLKLTIQGHK